MIVELIKDCKWSSGIVKRKGMQFDVTAELGYELIRQKKARRVTPKRKFEDVTKFL